MAPFDDDFWRSAGEDSLDVHLLGVVDFDSALELQQQLALQLRNRDDRRACCLVCEHPPLITVGREGSHAQIVCDAGELVACRLDVRWLNRGGGALIHSPGQVVMYPVLPLDRLGLSVAGIRDLLADVGCRACGEQRLPVQHMAGSGSLAARGGQIGQVGLAVRSGFTWHGLYLNVNPSPRFYQMIDAGLGRQTSIASERVRPISTAGVRESLVRHLARQLGYERFHLYTGHPLLKRTRRVVAHA